MELKEILAKCDHTLLLQPSTWEEIKAICDDGIKFGCASVCIPASFVKDAKEYDEKLKKYFDAVLCDAPCSGLGVVNDNPDIKLNRTEEDVYSLIREQREILNTVKNYVKVGGYLYYSTCSVLKIENDRTVEAFLENNKNFEVEEIESKLNGEKAQ